VNTLWTPQLGNAVCKAALSLLRIHNSVNKLKRQFFALLDDKTYSSVCQQQTYGKGDLRRSLWTFFVCFKFIYFIPIYLLAVYIIF
jgi:hypothetical protein